jgi:hypothetical protein
MMNRFDERPATIYNFGVVGSGLMQLVAGLGALALFGCASEPSGNFVTSHYRAPASQGTVESVPLSRNQESEFVRVKKVLEFNKAMIQRDNGELWQIESGVGTLLSHQEGKRVLIHSPSVFAGIGSKLVFPEGNQSTPILNSKRVEQSISPAGVRTSAVRSSGHWISGIDSEGAMIMLEDRTIWEVSPVDRINSSLWLRTSSITITEGNNPKYPYKLINTNDRETVDAKPLRRD